VSVFETHNPTPFRRLPSGKKTPNQHSSSLKKIAPPVFIGFSGREEGKLG
jgi:hypothetical protein